MEDESSVRVAVRIRPQIPREVIDMCRVCTFVTPGEPQITLSSDRSFTYDYVFDMGADQVEVYETCVQRLVEGSLEGYNATVLAYGQTGSGKTYTMGTGFEVEMQEGQLGILPRAIGHLFSGIRERVQNARQNGEPSPEFKVVAQFMELYNDEIIDLLDQAYMTRGLKIHEDHDGGISVKGITQQSVESAAETLNLLRQGALSRTTGATQMNAQSSRSHAIFTLLITQQRLVKIEDGETEDSGKSEFATLSAKFHFVDLAGSERLKRTQATGERAREGICINAGLFALGNVISALGDKSKKALHVPYRDSKLTRLLQDSLGGNSQTVMIACISPSDSDFMETLNTLNYANRARNIKNKVMVNQDKSSRTIALLREQIQQLQIELLEYKQGKRLVSPDGVEVVNDMCNENILLRTESDNLRTRLKALQETVDTLSQKNTELLAEKATSMWMGSEDGPSDMKEIITEYLRQIEELRAKLLESEAMCQQLRKNASRQIMHSSYALSPTNSPRIPNVHDSTEKGLTVSMPFQNYNNLSRKDHNYSFSETSALISEAKMDLTKDIDLLTKITKKEKNGNDNRLNDDSDNSDIDDEEDDAESNSESSDTEDNKPQYDVEILELSNEISIKQQLIEELERSQQKMLSMKQHYEDKLLQLQDRIKATQEERDKVLASITSSGHSNQSSDKVKKIKEEYEKKLTDMQREMKRLESARKEHARLLREQNHQSNQLKSLQTEVDDMKRIRVNLIRKMNEESKKHKQAELKHTREIAALRKESRRRENEIKSLQAENRVTKAVLRRRNEEVSSLRSRALAAPMLSSKAAGRVVSAVGGVTSRSISQKTAAGHFSPKNAKTKWSKIESSLSKVKVNKKAVVLIEKDMERLLGERETVGKELEQLVRKRNQLRLSPSANPNELRMLEEQIDAAQANMNYIQESISGCQHDIIEMEDVSKGDGDSFELNAMLDQVQTIDECKYLIEKLYNANIAQSIAGVQLEINIDTLNGKVNQLSSENETQNALLQHLIHRHHDGGSGNAMDHLQPLAGSNSRSNSENSSAGSSRSVSPTQQQIPSATHLSLSKGLNDLKTNASSDSLFSGKSRRYTALPKDLLFPNKEVEDVKTTSSRHAMDIPSLQRSMSHRGSELPQPIHKGKPYQDIVSPRLPRRAVNTSNTRLDNMTETTDSPPGSPTTYRRFNSREENVFSRLTGGPHTESTMDIGRITEYQGKISSRAPLICGHVASGHTRSVLSVDATNDLLFTGSQDRSVKVWDLHTAQEIHNLPGHYNNVDVVKYCEISRLLFSVSSAYVKVWDLRKSPPQCIKTLCSSGLSVAGSAQSTNPSRTLTVPPGEAQVNDIALNHSGKTLYTAAGDRARVWDLRMFSCIGKLAGGHQAAVKCLAVAKISETEDLVITGSKDHYIKVFEISANDSSGAFPPKITLDPPHYDGIQTLALQGDILYSGSRDMCIKKWELSRGDLIQSINNAHADWICGLNFLPGGEKLVSGCRSGFLKVWSADTCSLLGEVKAHNSSINSIAVNSTLLFTASSAGDVKFWRPQLRDSIMTMSTGRMYNTPFDSSVRFWKPHHISHSSHSRIPPSSPQKEQRTSPAHHAYNTNNTSPIHAMTNNKSSSNTRSAWVS